MPFPCRRSPRAQTLIQKAFTELELVFNVADARRFRNTTIQDVQVQCVRIENELGARGLLRNMGRLQPFLRGLECYGKAVETLCQGTPFLPWIWAPITVILKLSSECIKAFETLIKAYAKIGESLGRFERLRSAFASDLGFQQILAIYYRDIAKFHEHAYKFVSVNGWRLFFRTTWGRFEGQFTTTLDNLKRHGELIDQETNTKNAIAIQKLLDLESRRNEELRRVQNARKEESNRQYKDIISQLQVQQSESDQDSICKSLAKAQGEHDGTCSWIWKHGKTAAWLSETDDTHTLWLQGSAGSGKSILADNLAKYLTLKGQVVVCHFCSELYDSSTDYDQILKSIISQLAELSSESIAYTHEILMGQKKLTNPILVGIVKALVPLISGSSKEHKVIWVILDGVDSCDAATLDRCLKLMDSLVSKNRQSGTKCKVLLTSRDEPRGNSSRRPPTVLLSEHKEHLKSSIQLYVLNRLRSLEMAERLRQLDINGDKVTDLGNKITAKADGMFLYARLIVDFLSRQLFPTAGRLEEAIDNPPQELKDFYRKIISTILLHLDEDSVDSVKCVLGSIGTSKVPLKRTEVLSAITFSRGEDDVERLVPSFFLEDCSYILEEKSDKSIGFIHASVKEFLLSEESPIPINQEEAHRQRSLAIVTCLTSAAKVFVQSNDQQRAQRLVAKGIYSFLDCASKQWVEHVLSYIDSPRHKSHPCSAFTEALQRLTAIFCALRPIHSVESLSTLRSRDRRLELLPHSIQPYIVSAFSQQSQEAIQSAVFAEDGPPGTAQAASAEYDVVSQILSNYRDTVSQLLRQGYCHGISKEEFDFFSSHAKNPLFTCRIPLCPRALMGFETEPELRNHEFEHINQFACPVDGCLYSSFSSIQSRDRHMARDHGEPGSRWTLRRVERFTSDRTRADTFSIGIGSGFETQLGSWAQERSFVGPEDMDLDLPPNHSLSDIFGAVRQGNFGNR